MVLEHVHSCFTIQNGTLINYAGNSFPKIPFKSILHEQLAFQLKDSIRTEIIYSAYEDVIVPTVNQAEKLAFEKALLQVCQLLVGQQSAANTALQRALEYTGFPLKEWLHNHAGVLDKFLSLLNLESSPRNVKATDQPMRIALITTSSSGGNYSVAMAIKGLLDKYPKLFNTMCLDYEAYSMKGDPIAVASGKYTQDSIYRLLQQSNVVNEMLATKDLVCLEAARFIQNTTGRLVKEAIQSFHPHMVISTRNYYPDDFNVCELGIPFRMLNCDYEMCFFHDHFVGKVDSNRIKFWLPSESPRFFKGFFGRYHRPDLYCKDDKWDDLMSKIATVTKAPLKEIKNQFEVVGYPTRFEICRNTDPSWLNETKLKWDLQEGEQGIIIEMGANGVGSIQSIFDLLAARPPLKTPVKFFFVCGKNEGLKVKLTEILASKDFKQTALKRCSVHGFINAQEKNELLNISSMMISKPGGAAQAELSKMRVPMFIMFAHDHEVSNKEKLKDEGLVYEYDKAQPLSDQLEKALEHAKTVSKAPPHLPTWEELLLQRLTQ